MKDKQAIFSEARSLLSDIYEQYSDKGILSIYIWGSITRNDFDPSVSDVDSLIIVSSEFDLDLKPEISGWIKDHFSQNMKFGMQFYGIDELNGEKPRTLLAELQPPGYILLRFNDWVHVAGKSYARSDFSVVDMSPEQAVAHQVRQVKNALAVITGEMPPDPRRSSANSYCEDAIKGAIGALYWQSVVRGNKDKLNYNDLPKLVLPDQKTFAEKLLDVRKSGAYNKEAVLSLLPELQSLATA